MKSGQNVNKHKGDIYLPEYVLYEDRENIPLAEHSLSDDDAESAASSSCSKKPLLCFFPCVQALTKTTDVWCSLSLSPETSSLGKVIPSTIITFFSTFELTGETSIENLHETCNALQQLSLPPQQRRLPRGWASLSRAEEALAITLTTAPALFNAFAEGMDAYFFAYGLPESYKFSPKVNLKLWSAASTSLGVGVAFTTLLTETKEQYRIVRASIVWEDPPPHSLGRKIMTLGLGGMLGLLDASQKAIQNYIAMKTIFGAKHPYWKILISIPCVVNIFPSLGFYSVYSVNALNDAIDHLQSRQYSLKSTIAFILSGSLAIFMATTKQPLNRAFHKSVVADFGKNPDDIPAAVYDLVVGLLCAEEIFRTTNAMCGPMSVAMDRGINKTKGFLRYIQNRCKGNKDLGAQEYEAVEYVEPLLLNQSPNNSDIDLKSTIDHSQDELSYLPSEELKAAFTASDEVIDLGEEEFTTYTTPLSSHPATLFSHHSYLPDQNLEATEEYRWCVLI
jgi:hypothetical protein